VPRHPIADRLKVTDDYASALKANTHRISKLFDGPSGDMKSAIVLSPAGNAEAAEGGCRDSGGAKS
jgi:hypothetical protein